MRLKWSMSRIASHTCDGSAAGRLARLRCRRRGLVRRLFALVQHPLQLALEAAPVVQPGQLVALALMEQRGVVRIDPRKAVGECPTGGRWHVAVQLQRADRAAVAQDGHDQPVQPLHPFRLHFQPVHATMQKLQRRIGQSRIDYLQLVGALRVRLATHDALHIRAVDRPFGQDHTSCRGEFGQRKDQAVVECVDIAVVGERRHRLEQARMHVRHRGLRLHRRGRAVGVVGSHGHPARQNGVRFGGLVLGHQRSRHRRLWASGGACVAVPQTVSPIGSIGRRIEDFSRQAAVR